MFVVHINTQRRCIYAMKHIYTNYFFLPSKKEYSMVDCVDYAGI
jgi:hypothetical protein